MASTSASGGKTPTKSGIITDNETGQRHIPSSTRADGSKRKEIKIRPGYRPPEDVEVYKNRAAHAFATRGTGPIPGSEGWKDDNGKTEGGKLNKNAKRREARKKAKAEGGIEDEEDVEKEPSGVVEETKEPALSKEEEEKIEHEKKARKLKKKLREARELQEKKEKGEKLLHEQFEKVIKINELIRDLNKLGFDSNGEPKQDP